MEQAPTGPLRQSVSWVHLQGASLIVTAWRALPFLSTRHPDTPCTLGELPTPIPMVLAGLSPCTLSHLSLQALGVADEASSRVSDSSDGQKVREEAVLGVLPVSNCGPEVIVRRVEVGEGQANLSLIRDVGR